jgi:hypothetical protein
LKLMPPVGEMMCEPMPRQFSGSRTCMGPKWSRRLRQFM